ADHKLGVGWSPSAALDTGLVFSRLADHSSDPDYPSGTVELVEADGSSDFFFGDGKNGYAGLLDGASHLDRNGDGTWSLLLADGGSSRINQVADPAGHVTYVDYDASNRVLRVRQRHGGADYTTSIDYTSAFNPKVTSYRGNLALCDSSCKAYYTTTYGLDAN